MAKAITIRRGYAGEAGRQVHYRIAGHGPPLLLFHQSPRSSAEYLELIERWASNFTVIAPDTPGYGASDPLARPEVPQMPDFAAAMAGFMDDIRLARAAVYGFHTGASLAVALAAQAPERIAGAVANGLALLVEEERKEILQHYLPAFEPVWDGSHLAWLWARLREQVVFFPWYDRRNETRLNYPMHTPEKMEPQVLDMLWAGDQYSSAYRAAFTFDKLTMLAQVTAPLTIMAAPPDPLAGHLDRLGDVPPGVRVERPDNAGEAVDRALEILRETSLPPFDLAAPTAASGAELSRGFVAVASGSAQMHYRRAGQSNVGTIILLHDLYSGSRVLEDEILFFAKDHDVIALDLPGHGLSDDLPPGTEAAPAAYAERLAQAIAVLCPKELRIISFGLSATTAVALAARMGDRLTGLVLADSHFPGAEFNAEFAARYLPDLTPNEHGGHLLAGWRFARAQALFWPWFREDPAGVRPVDDEIQPAKIHARFVALWESRARDGSISPLFFVAPGPDSFAGLPLRWITPEWAAGMAGMAKPWSASAVASDTSSYPDGDSGARRAALADAVSRP